LEDKVSQFKNRVKTILKEHIRKKDIHKSEKFHEFIDDLKKKYGENFTKSMTSEDIIEILNLSNVKRKYLEVNSYNKVTEVGNSRNNSNYNCYQYEIDIEFELNNN
jgi:hypothetical protein